jgi:diaminopimelate epimerase
MEGTGNDFIVFDNRDRIFTGNEAGFFSRICQRRFAVGADGVILIEKGQSFKKSGLCSKPWTVFIPFESKIMLFPFK